MKRIQLTILLAVFTFTYGLSAQEVAENQPALQEQVEQIVEEALETEGSAVEGVEEAGQDAVEAVGGINSIEEADSEDSDEVESVEEPAATPVEATPIDEPDWVRRGELVNIGGNNHLAANEKAKEMVTVAGNSTIEGHVDGDAVTVLGNSKLDGYVDGDFVVVMGSAEFGPNAEVEGDAVVIGGKIDLHPGAKVDGERVNIPFFPPGAMPYFQEVPVFLSECVFLARPISPNVKMTLFIAGVFLVFYILLAAIFPKPLERCCRALEEKPFQSFLAGILVHACHPLFLILMAIIVIGLVLIPFVDMAILAFSIFGKAVVFCYIGRQIAKAIRASALENAILSIIIGGVIVYALYMIPFFGLFLWIVLSILGLGAVTIAIGNSISEKKAEKQAAMPQPDPGAPPLPVTSEQYTAEPVQPGTSLSQIDAATASLFVRVGFWWRTLATLIDVILIAVIVNVLNIGMPIIPFFAYFIVFWGWKGSTLGGMALGIRIQKISGEPLDWSTGIIRSLSAIVSFLPFFIGFFWAGWDPEHQSWHDKIAGTTVVQIPKGYTWN